MGAIHLRLGLSAVRDADDIVEAMRLGEELRRIAPFLERAEVAELVDGVDDTDPVVAIAAVHALAATDGPVADSVLVRLLEAPQGWLVEHAAWALSARRPQFTAVGHLVELHGARSFTAMVAQRTLLAWSRSATAPQPSSRVRVGCGEAIGTDIELAIGAALVLSDDPVVRRRLVDTLAALGRGSVASVLRSIARSDDHDEVRSAAVAGLAVRGRQTCADADDVAFLRELATVDDPVGTAALLALDDATSIAHEEPPARSGGLRVAQLTLTGMLDPSLSTGGRGDTGGVASVLVSLGSTLARRNEIDSVLTIGRGSPSDEVTSLLEPDHGADAYASIAVGDDASPPLADLWDRRLGIERSLRRVLENRPPVDVMHLRMADVGTLAAASVLRHSPTAVVFTAAPDPHVPIRARQSSGELRRDRFGRVDEVEHLWFRARMVERLVEEADRLVTMPRNADDVATLLGVDPDRFARRATVVAEGIDLPAVDAAIARGVGSAAALFESSVPVSRQELPTAITVGRLHPNKGVVRLVRDWVADDVLRERTNLLIVGGAVDEPNAVERAVLGELRTLLDGADAGVYLLGAVDHPTVLDLLALADGGAGTGGGVYVNGAPKEEFGLALLEALAIGLPVVAPAHGGPATYVEDQVTGILVGPDEPLGPAIRAAFELRDRPGRRERARSIVRERYSIDRFADRLVDVYTIAATGARVMG